MARTRIHIDTGSVYTRLLFTPYIARQFRGYLDVITNTQDGSTIVHLQVYAGKDSRGNDEYYVNPDAVHRVPLLNQDGSPQRDTQGKPTYKITKYGGINDELRQRIKTWLTPTLNHFFLEHPDGHVAQPKQETATSQQSIPQPGHVVAEDGEDSDLIAEKGF